MRCFLFEFIPGLELFLAVVGDLVVVRTSLSAGHPYWPWGSLHKTKYVILYFVYVKLGYSLEQCGLLITLDKHQRQKDGWNVIIEIELIDTNIVLCLSQSSTIWVKCDLWPLLSTWSSWSAQISIYFKHPWNLQHCLDMIEILALSAGICPAARAIISSI